MKHIFHILALCALFTLGFATPAAAQADMDCWEFGNWWDAQATHEAYPWMGLDGDWDGIACECLYYGYACWTPWS